VSLLKILRLVRDARARAFLQGALIGGGVVGLILGLMSLAGC